MLHPWSQVVRLQACAHPSLPLNYQPQAVRLCG